MRRLAIGIVVLCLSGTLALAQATPQSATSETTPDTVTTQQATPPPTAAGNADATATPETSVRPATDPVRPASDPADFNGPTADIVTSMGTITLALAADKAPQTVKNFIRYAKWGRFNHKVVYRVEPGFVVQMGCVDAKGHGCRQSRPVSLESSNGLYNIRGAVAMAHGDKPNSATSEFFINLADHPTLDAVPDLPPNTSGFAVFAHVMKGMDVLDKIAAVATKGGYGPFPDAAPKKVIQVYRVRIHLPHPGK